MEDTSYSTRISVKDPLKIQLYSYPTPNGIKVASILEELVDIRRTSDEFNYEAHTIDIRQGESRTEDFRQVSVAGKVPAIIDPAGPGGRTISLFESGAILMYLAEKFDVLLPHSKDSMLRYEVLKWFMWASTNVSTQFKLFGFYYKYCTHKLPYCTQRYTKECKRLLNVLNHQLAGKEWVTGNAYTIADIALWPWVYALFENYDNAVRDAFNNFKSYPNVLEWYQRCLKRPANRRALETCVPNF